MAEDRSLFTKERRGVMETIYRVMKRKKDGYCHACFTDKPSTREAKNARVFNVDNAALALPWFNKYYGRDIPGCPHFSWAAASSNNWKTESSRQELAKRIDNPLLPPPPLPPTPSKPKQRSGMQSLLWQPCDTCGCEPSCMCGGCKIHCTCDD